MGEKDENEKSDIVVPCTTKIALDILHLRMILTRVKALFPNSRAISANPRIARIDVRSRKETGIDAARATIFGIDTVVLITRTISSTESTPSGNHGTTRQSEEDGTLTTRFGSHIHRFAVGNIHVIGISYFHFSFDFFYFASGFGGHHFLLQLYNTAPKKR